MLAEAKAHLILGCRNISEGNKLANELKYLTNNSDIEVMKLDLSSLHSIRVFCLAYEEKEYPLDILINNAGIIGNDKYEKSENNLEMHFSVNVLGPFLLTKLLLNQLRDTEHSRVVFLSSFSHWFGNPFYSVPPTGCCFSRFRAYCNSKLQLNQICYEYSLRERNIHFYTVHPGAINTQLYRNFKHSPMSCYGCIEKSVEEGCSTTIYCSVSKLCEYESGLYYGDCKTKRSRLGRYWKSKREYLFSKCEEICENTK